MLKFVAIVTVGALITLDAEEKEIAAKLKTSPTTLQAPAETSPPPPPVIHDDEEDQNDDVIMMQEDDEEPSTDDQE